MTVDITPRSSAVPRGPTPEQVAKKIGAGRRTRVPRWAIVVTALAAAALAGAALASSRTLKQQPTRYETADVSRGSLEVTISATGTLSAVGVVEVGSEVSGKVQSVHVAENARVTKGQVLAEIDPMQLSSEVATTSAQVAASRAAIAQAEATATEAHLARERAEEQAKLGLIAQKDLETARAADLRAQAAVLNTRANASLSNTTAATARWKLTRTKIVAPTDGVVLARQVEPGQVVQASFQTPVLFKIAKDLTELELEVDIDEADVGRAKEGQKASFQVDAWPDRQFPSTLKTIGNVATTTNGVVSYTAKLSVDNKEMVLRPGMTASATIVTEARDDALLVPSSAFRFMPPGIGASGMPGPPGLLGPSGPKPAASAPVAKDPRNKFVWVLTNPGQLEPVEVRPEATDGSKTAVTGNLQPGMKVALDVLEGP